MRYALTLLAAAVVAGPVVAAYGPVHAVGVAAYSSESPGCATQGVFEVVGDPESVAIALVGAVDPRTSCRFMPDSYSAADCTGAAYEDVACSYRARDGTRSNFTLFVSGEFHYRLRAASGAVTEVHGRLARLDTA